MKEYKTKVYDSYASFEIVNKKGMVFEVLVDIEDLDRVIKFNYSWNAIKHISANTYYVKATEYLGKVDGKHQYRSVMLHRFVMNAKDNEVVDHMNYNSLDNRKSNLRTTSIEKNLLHREKRNSNNKSGYRNVCWITSEGKWVVQLQINGKCTRLGSFSDVHEAGEFAEKMRLKYYKEFHGDS